ncbi:MAG: 8-oxoguanine deaminase [Acidimicrobiaceae bacterium]|nr:8-oxoguanine deaminase [Acidimicrobiaceae bacterium]
MSKPVTDLLVRNARLVATMDPQRTEISGGWVAVAGGFVTGVGPSGSEPADAVRTIDAGDCLVTPGLINTHHHLYQNLTRAYRPALGGSLFDWLRTLYPLWSRLDEEAAHVSAWIGLAELALSGCTTSTDHLYVHPEGAGDLISAEIAAATALGVRFHPTRGSMSLSVKDGGLPPDRVVQSDEVILAESERLVAAHHDASPGAMVRVALAPCSPFSVSTELMRATAELAERLDVRLHTHLAEDPDEDDFCLEMFGMRPVDYFEHCGWAGDRSWVAHCVQPDPAEIARLGRWGTGVAHCPSSNMILGAGVAPVRELSEAGVPVGLGVDGSASSDSGSLWTEARNAMLLARLRDGRARRDSLFTARQALELATRGGAACLGRAGELGELSVGACGDIAVWRLDGIAFAGAWSDPVEAWLRCGPVSACHTVVAGRAVVSDGRLVADSEQMLRDHRRIAARLQSL